MLRFVDLIQNPRRFLALTGYTMDEFRALLSFFIVRFQAYVAIFTLEGKPRRNRTYSTYKNSSLPTMEDQLHFILNYLKTYPLQESHAQVFGMQQSQASQWIHLLLPLVKASLADCGELPARKREDSTLAEDEAGLFCHDGTERPINRPQDPEEQHLYYSGKQKEYTVKNDVVIDEPCKIRFLSDTVRAKRTTKDWLMHRATVFPKAVYEPKMLAFKAFDLQGLPFCNRERNPAEVSCPTQTKCAIASFRVFGFASSMPSAVSSAIGLSKTSCEIGSPVSATWCSKPAVACTIFG